MFIKLEQKNIFSENINKLKTFHFIPNWLFIRIDKFSSAKSKVLALQNTFLQNLYFIDGANNL